jgi:hypothetical protein
LPAGRPHSSARHVAEADQNLNRPLTGKGGGGKIERLFDGGQPVSPGGEINKPPEKAALRGILVSWLEETFVSPG